MRSWTRALLTSAGLATLNNTNVFWRWKQIWSYKQMRRSAPSSCLLTGSVTDHFSHGGALQMHQVWGWSEVHEEELCGTSWQGWGSAVPRNRKQISRLCSCPRQVTGVSACKNQGCHIPATIGFQAVHELPCGTCAGRCVCLECFIPESWPWMSPPCWGWAGTWHGSRPAAEAAGHAFEVATGLSTGPVWQVSDVEWPTQPSGSSEVPAVCLLLKWLCLRPRWVWRLCALVLCGIVWHFVAYGLLLKANWEVRGCCHAHRPFMKPWPPAWPLGQRNRVICKTWVPLSGSTGCLFTRLREQRQQGMLRVEQYLSVFCSFGLKQAPSEIRFLWGQGVLLLSCQLFLLDFLPHYLKVLAETWLPPWQKLCTPHWRKTSAGLQSFRFKQKMLWGEESK